MKHSVIQFVHPELQNLYNLLEVEFHPLRLYQKVKASIDFISQNDDLAVYVPALEDILVTRVLKQVHRMMCLWGGGGGGGGVREPYLLAKMATFQSWFLGLNMWIVGGSMYW